MTNYGAMIRFLLISLSSMIVVGCASGPTSLPDREKEPELIELPRPQSKVVVAVYDFPDLTGQHRQTESGQAHFSKAVTQGGSAVLIGTLQSAGLGDWFSVVERNQLQNVLTERSIIREQRQGRVDSNNRPLPPPAPLMYAGVIFEGGIIGYDTNVVTGGAGARFLGIGSSTQYREDQVTVYLRAVSSQTSEIWTNVVASKVIYSVQVRGDAFRYIDADEILEVEAGFTRNEPRLIALRRAVEHAVYSTVIEGAQKGLWQFADAHAGRDAIANYINNHGDS